MTADPEVDPLSIRVADALRRLPGGAAAWGTTGVLAAAPVASPVHRAVASDCIRVERAGSPPVFIKIRHADMATDVVPWAADAARKAAELGVGPEVLGDATGVLALACLDPPWRTATVGDLQDADTLGRVLEAKRRLHEAPPLGRRFCPFDRIAALATEAAAVGAPLPRDAPSLLAAVGLVREAVEAAGFDLRFCHNDGTASNVMLDGTALRLVDFDTAGDNDPWFDVAATINEACDFDAERRVAIMRYAGGCDERAFNRCRLYGAVDDVMWGLWGVTRAMTTRRSGVEFFKYGQWRLLHARAAIGARDFETWLRRL
ncbi:phosphotransferase family protein [Lichenibacterium dinghuense]|uniref:phosphotransferase family protein n=1 Tax=Lichenibacterium dinghuense TaxID=2895977 RepID=UPI001F26C2CD|nr:phosphotransferase [Lichenibacterium sp. 6Y81]